MEDWKVEEVIDWLKNCGFQSAVQLKFRDNAIDGYTLVRLCEADLRYIAVISRASRAM